MAVTATANWYVRVSGAQTNGGGYDGSAYPGGSNFADQDNAQATLTTASVVGATTTQIVVSALDYTVTANDVGNCLRISGGTATTGYYFITAANTGTNTWTMDRSVGTAAQTVVGKMGGAHANILSYANGGAGTQPTLATPLVPGNTINIRGSGSNTPSSSDYTQGDYLIFPVGSITAGYIQWIGYNGRPFITGTKQLIWYQTQYHRFSNIMNKTTTATYSVGVMEDVTADGSTLAVDNVWFDQNGQDMVAVFTTGKVTNCKFFNTGATTSAGTNAAIFSGGFAGLISGNTIDGWRGGGIKAVNMTTIVANLIVNTKAIGIEIDANNAGYASNILGNTIYNNTGDGIKVDTSLDIVNTVVRNNIIVKNGGYGLNLSVNSSALNNKLALYNDYNNYGTGATANTSGAINNGSLGAHDVQLDPQFTSTSGGNFAVGTNMQNIGFPSTYPEGNTISYVTLGAAQPQAGGGSSGTVGYAFA